MALAAVTAIVFSTEATADGGDKPDIWRVTVGGYWVSEPRFEGSRSSSPGFKPQISIRSPGSRDWLILPNDGIDLELVETDRFRAGPVLNWKWYHEAGAVPRGARRIGSLDHLGSIDFALEGGAFAEFWPATWLRTRAELRGGLIGADGVIADVSADLVWRPGAWTVTGGARLSVADASFMRAYYGVDAAQAVRLDTSPYTPSAGVRSVGAGSMVTYRWSETWTTMAFVEYMRLAGEAAPSPLIREFGTRDQVTAGIGLTVTFDVKP